MSEVRHFLHLRDWSDAELHGLLDLAARLKTEGHRSREAAGKVLGLLFFNPSLRTKVSFETAAAHLGAASSLISPGQGSWSLETGDGVVMDGNKTEHVKEAIQVLSRYVDTLGVRAFEADDAELARMASYAAVPLINLESATEHPCQGLADWLTLRELFGPKPAGKTFVLSWAPHPVRLPVAVPNTALEVASRSGMDVRVVCPPEYVPDAPRLEAAAAACARHGSRFDLVHDQATGFEGAHVVYAKSWGAPALAAEPEREQALRWETYRNWTVSPELMARTDQAAFMHCLPVRRNVVVADAVLDSPAAVHIRQAENRMHVQKALLMQLWHLS